MFTLENLIIKYNYRGGLFFSLLPEFGGELIDLAHFLKFNSHTYIALTMWHHCSKHFITINSYNPNMPMKKVQLLSLFTDE